MRLDDSTLSNLPADLAAQIRELDFLVRSAHRLNTSLELRKRLAIITEIVQEGLKCEAVSLLLYKEESGRLRFYVAANHIRPEGEHYELGLDEGLAGWIFKNGLVVRIRGAASDPRVQTECGGRIQLPIREVLGIPLQRGHRITGVIEALNKGEGGFTEEDENLLRSLSDTIAVSLENALLYRMIQREKLETESLYRISLKLNQTLKLKEILPLLLDLLKQAIPYHAAAIYLTDAEGKDVEFFMGQGYDAASERQAHLKMGQGAVGWVAKTGKPLLMEDVAQDVRYFRARATTRSELVVPIVSESRVIGAFNLESDHLGMFNKSDVKLLTTFASQAAISIERARLHEELLEKRRLEQEIKIARSIQEASAPRRSPEITGMGLAGLNVPSRQVSGDLYDFLAVHPGHTGILIADVAGKGVPAALVGARFQASMRAEIRNNYAIATILGRVNDLLLESGDAGSFITAVYGVLDIKTRRLTYSNAGHNPPLLLRADDRVEWLWEGGTVLGAFPHLTFEEQFVTLEPGDIVVFYTDGITEATDGRGEEFGSERLVETVRKLRGKSPHVICRGVVDATRVHEEMSQADDLTVVVLKASLPTDK
ncbi:MAG: SpoIIE family protein phosphatase [Candidatus Eisenbacteria bacterium]|uniref:SpoIIE family protein phosphatase n=1 Tax=Eiseniibacteriota bacterium TaxID=2212470 RepID=A0A948WC40_UNCEI|nr:SpoIIE family protein phosphatase [Candidatus Eisenbacteria bacterium]MBU1948243.1 SpoIIE family protein phosphatase [Candidatus Eisenbacteria bacterium]MBU2690563.1 SpoIIE family protein phosphatase [Candidatus Eisenbacteria bacterium]